MSMILQTAGVGTTIGRAINTFKLNIRAAAQIMMIPLVISALEGVVNAIPSAIHTLTMPDMGRLVITALAALLVFFLSIASVFITTLFCAPIIRINYSTLTHPAPMSLHQSIADCKKSIGTLIALTLYALISLIIFGVIDAILAVIALFGLTAIMVASTTITTMFKSSSVAGPFFITTLVISGAILTIVTLAILGFQMMMSFLPLVCASTSHDMQKRGFVQSLGYGFRMLFANLPRAVLFGILLIIFWGVVATVLQLPVGIWMGIELRRFDDALQPGTIPLHVSFVVNLITSVVKTVMTPFGLCAIALFWYDCQVRKEGVDLAQWLTRMKKPSPDTVLEAA